MTFTTLTFLLFLLVVFGLYWWLEERRRQNLLLLIASYFFYGWWDWRFCGLMLASSVADYSFALALERFSSPRARRGVVAASCVFNLTILGFFKYFNFFAENARAFLASLGWQVDLVTINVILPVGISFYTFQSMSYIIDVYRRQMQPTRSLLDYLTYVAFFPQLVAGPIERGAHLLPQVLNPRKFDYPLAVDGLRLMLWGFFKKMAVADNCAQFVDLAYGAPEAYSGPHLLFATVAFAFQIYGDFSGYSDIAIGTARLFGFNLMRNFAYPYFAQSVSEFWRRWHISLSTWFRDYLYVPLGGNRVSVARLAVNIMITFVISGLWHGAAWTFIIWGALNGLGILPALFLKGGKRLTPAETPGGERWLPPLATSLKMAATFAFILFTWVFFRATSLHDAIIILDRTLLHPVLAKTAGFSQCNLSTAGLVVLLLFFVAVEWVQRRHWHPLHWDRWPGSLRYAGYSLLIWGTLYLAPLQSGAFIYFQF